MAGCSNGVNMERACLGVFFVFILAFLLCTRGWPDPSARWVKVHLKNTSYWDRSEKPANLPSPCLMKEKKYLCYISPLEWLWCIWYYSIIICVFLSYYFQQITVSVWVFKSSGTAEHKDRWKGSSGGEKSQKKVPLFPEFKGLEENAFEKDEIAQYILCG